ncbi:MAG: DNA-deoxyinosine glycosylase [Clostridia bacterium]|nr:DNA-deoxyinosine glycosylase [Clostridia bacterium]MBQ3062024.1 DNA-deoxyinosine glycosylase [Clostridia bacterium]
MQKGFEPIYSKESRALILGTWPSPKSFEMGFYYGHKQNRFWPLMARLAQRDVPVSIDEKKAIILESGLALWDTIESCTIEGAADASIRDVEARDLVWLMKEAPIEAVFCNGAKAYEIYMKNQYPQTGIAAVKLPSTSPANAAWSLERLCDEWSIIKKYMK